jgi:hypothetical protein
MYLMSGCTKSVSHLCNMGRSLLGGDKRQSYSCAGALAIPKLLTDVDDPRLLGPETTKDLYHELRSKVIKYVS